VQLEIFVMMKKIVLMVYANQNVGMVFVILVRTASLILAVQEQKSIYYTTLKIAEVVVGFAVSKAK